MSAKRRHPSYAFSCKYHFYAVVLLLNYTFFEPHLMQTNSSTIHDSNTSATFSDASSEVNTDQGSQLDVLIDRLQPQHWLNPGAVPWGDWDIFLDNNETNGLTIV
jgi:hypothetical protein